MNEILRTSNEYHDPVLLRLEQMQIGECERIYARAELARAQVVAAALEGAGRALKRAWRVLVARPSRRLLADLG